MLLETGTGQRCTKAASIFIRWLKFLQLKTSHPVVESLVLDFFWVKNMFKTLYLY